MSEEDILQMNEKNAKMPDSSRLAKIPKVLEKLLPMGKYRSILDSIKILESFFKIDSIRITSKNRKFYQLESDANLLFGLEKIAENSSNSGRVQSLNLNADSDCNEFLSSANKTIKKMLTGNYDNTKLRWHRDLIGLFCKDDVTNENSSELLKKSNELNLAISKKLHLSNYGTSFLEVIDKDGLIFHLGTDLDSELNISRIDASQSENLLRNRIYGAEHLLNCDINNDGQSDLFIVRSSLARTKHGVPNSLLVYDGSHNSYREKTSEYNLFTTNKTTCATVLDVDSDGWLDLFMQQNIDKKPQFLIYRNINGEMFEPVQLSNENSVNYRGAVPIDYDNNGAMDILLFSLKGSSKVLLNTTDSKIKFDVVEIDQKMSNITNCSIFDYNNDGWEDVIYFPNSQKLKQYAAPPAYFDEKYYAKLPQIYLLKGSNMGLSRSSEITADKLPNFVLSSVTSDFNNDGWQDLFVGTGTSEISSLLPNSFLLNENGKTFEVIESWNNSIDISNTYYASVADINSDGRTDLYCANGGYAIPDKQYDFLYENTTKNNNNWIQIKLNGITSNKLGFGCKVELTVTENGIERKIYRRMGPRSSKGTNPSQLEVGIGTATKIDSIKAYWINPTHSTDVWTNVEPNQRIILTEGKKEYVEY